MIRCILALATATAFFAAGFPSHAAPSKEAAPKAAASAIPAEIRFPSSVGEVVFHHQMHMQDLAVKCVDCHHQINAKQLHTPHPDYLGASWINCRICHDGSERIAQKAYKCSQCHQTGPKDIVDETLSAKVVTHKQCWKCHAVGTGKEASGGCEKCHSGKKGS